MALRPSGWWLATVVLWWALRGVGLVGRDAFTAMPFSPAPLAYALVVDALVVSVAFLSVRASTLIFRGSSALRRLTLAAAALWLVVWLVVRVADAAHCWMVSAHLTRGFWHHVDPSSLAVLTEPAALALIALTAALAAAVGYAITREGRGAGPLPGAGVTALARLAGATTAFAWLGLAAAVAVSWRHAPHPQHWALIPEVNAVSTFWRSHHQEAQGPARRPDAATLARLRAAGLVPQRPVDPAFPLQRPRLDGPGLPTAASAQADAARGSSERRPNVVLVLVESLSGGLVGDLTPRWKGLTPHLDRLAARMTTARNHFNSTSPTINGWLATLCSVVPSAWSLDVEAGESVDGGADFTCLTDLLARRGYRIEHVQGASRTFTATEAILRGHGYAQVVGREDLRLRYPNAPENKWGKYDDVTVKTAIETLTRLHAGSDPWMLSVATIDLHTPGYPRPGCKPPERFASDRVLAAAWCTDEALSRLWQKLDELDAWKDTVVIISGDHPIFPFPAVQTLFADKARQYGVFAQLPLLIHDPYGELPRRVTRLSSQLDVAPTIARMLRLKDEANTFQGRALQLPASATASAPQLAIGRMGSHTVHVRTPAKGRTLPFGALVDRCERTRAILAGPDEAAAADRRLGLPVSACDLLQLFRWQDDLWARRRLQPPRKRSAQEALALERIRQRWLQEDLDNRRRAPAVHGSN